MKLRSFLVAIVICTVAISGCNHFSSKPSDVVTSYFCHAEKGEVEEASKLYSSSFVNREGGMAKVKGNLSDYCRELKERGGFKSFEIVKEETFGEWADVTAKAIIPGAGEVTGNIKLVRENGVWKIDSLD